MKGLATIGETSSIKSDEDLIADSLERLFFTIEGGIPGLPKVGSRINRFFFDDLDEITAIEITNEIETLIDLYEPRIRRDVINVTIKHSEGLSKIGIIIEVKYTFVGSGEPGSAVIKKIIDNQLGVI